MEHKTNWENQDIVKAEDINRIEGNINELSNQKLNKTEFDNLTIGGRNLALNTSNTYTDVSYTPDAENANTFLNKVLNDGFNVGDTMMIRLIVRYTDIVSSDGKQALLKVSGNGDVTNWNTGYLEGSKLYSIEGSGEIEILHKITIKEEHLKNSYWDLRIVYWNIKSGTVQTKNIKVENSTKPTDWTPAPEDITPENIGAAPTKHTHSKDQIIDLSISHIGPSEPSDKNIFWIDTSTGGVLKYWNGSAWTPLKAVWG